MVGGPEVPQTHIFRDVSESEAEGGSFMASRSVVHDVSEIQTGLSLVGEFGMKASL